MAKGLCHKCLTSDTELTFHKGQTICMNCYHNSFKQTQENLPDPTYSDLKKKWTRE